MSVNANEIARSLDWQEGHGLTVMLLSVERTVLTFQRSL